jgi:protein-disulfide isomerase
VSEQGEGDGVDDGAAAQTTAEPSHSGSGSGDERVARLETQLARARAENETLRETLDDPEKYQQYQMEKATREFEAAEAHEIALDGIPYKGPEGAPIRVVEYSDFLCPFCRNLAGALANFMPQSGGRVAVFFKNYPLDQACNPSLSRTVHDGACELALGAVCAQEQDAFWAYHDAIFTEPPHNPNNDDVVRIAASAGLDADAMRSCLSSNDAERKLTADIEEAKQLAVTATPTVFVNGKRLQQIGSFMMAIESEATRLGLGRD